MKRGDIVLVALPGDLGKPRPAVVIQTDSLPPTTHVLVCPTTTSVQAEVVQRRVTVVPSPENKLRHVSQIMVDKITPVRREKCRDVIGHLGDETIEALNQALALIVGLLDQP